MKGSRVQGVVQELRGEKIDIVSWDPDSARFVCNAIAPAEVVRVVIHEHNKNMEVIVPDDQLSLAIGRKGQNVRLAAELTGWSINILSESKLEDLAKRAKFLLAQALGIEDSMALILYSQVFKTPEDIARSSVEDMMKIPGISEEKVNVLKAAAQAFVEKKVQSKSAGVDLVADIMKKFDEIHGIKLEKVEVSTSEAKKSEVEKSEPTPSEVSVPEEKSATSDSK